MNFLSSSELVSLFKSVFPPLAGDNALAILADLPHETNADSPEWKSRRKLASEWAAMLQNELDLFGLDSVDLVGYPAVGSNNSDLPEKGWFLDAAPLDLAIALEQQGVEISFEELFHSTDIIIALTQFSATAPLKVAAKKYRFRAATMPGFSEKMMPALRIDYGIVNKRCEWLKAKLDIATTATVDFLVDGKNEYRMNFDLCSRLACVSSGRFPEPGTAGNLPSGETFIVPYEGENNQPSKTHGMLPVQFENETVIFRIEENRAVSVISSGKQSTTQADYLNREPAYGNIAELGFGVLGDFGLKPIGEVLLDEKLGFHIAFGRSDHFGGAVGPNKFSSPGAVVHIDRIYIPETQPQILVKSVVLDGPNGHQLLLKNGKYPAWS